MTATSAQARLLGLLASLAATAGVALINLWTVYVVDSRQCGDEGHPPPPDGTARGDYCELFENANDSLTLLAGIVAYSPTLIVLVGAIWAAAAGSWRIFAWSLGVAAIVLGAIVLPMLVLPTR